jgi:hypothetical protein
MQEGQEYSTCMVKKKSSSRERYSKITMAAAQQDNHSKASMDAGTAM